MKQYRALVGLSYPATAKDVKLRLQGKQCAWKDVEPGEIVDDIPAMSVDWLLADGRIEEVDDGNLRA